MSPLMREIASLVFIHIWLAGFSYAIYDIIWGKGADRSYAARMKPPLRWFLMPGALSDKAAWVKQQRRIAWLAMPFVIFIYIGALVCILRGQYLF